VASVISVADTSDKVVVWLKKAYPANLISWFS